MKRASLNIQALPIKKTALLRRISLLSALTTSLLMSAAVPALAEAPVDDLAITQQNNVRQLVLLNECMGCDLSGVTLTAAHLIGVDLRNANLQFANLTGSNLEGADLTGADLTGANLTNTFLTNTCLAETNLDGVNFSGAHLFYVDVAGASMNNLNLTGAQLLETPIYTGGEEQLIEESMPLEPLPLIPFEETNPVEPYEPLMNPVL
ncbi:MAG: pentapeptide repeat-containing protein [Phormidesmis sp.]